MQIQAANGIASALPGGWTKANGVIVVLNWVEAGLREMWKTDGRLCMRCESQGEMIRYDMMRWDGMRKGCDETRPDKI